MARKSVIKFHHIVNFFGDEPKLIEKGENAVESGHVKSMAYDGDKNTIRGLVEASMKNQTYNVQINLKDDGQVESAICTCPRGQVRCHHIAAMLLYSKDNISATDKLCSWTFKKPLQKTDIKTVSELFPAKEYKAVSSVTPNIKNEVFERLTQQNAIVGFNWLLCPEPAPQSSVLKHPTLDEVLFSEQFRTASNKAKFLAENCSLTEPEIKVIADETLGQGTNWKWSRYRSFRLTASNFAIILGACRRKSFPPSLFKKLMGNYNLEGVRAVQWGKQNEKTAINVFEAAIGKVIKNTGLWLHSCGLLGASPDGLIHEEDGSVITVEVKCPFKYRHDFLSQSLKRDKNYILTVDDNGVYTINKNHQYYHQIQGQLCIVKAKMAFLILWTPKECVIFPVERDESWICNVDILLNFYVNQFIPWVDKNKF